MYKTNDFWIAAVLLTMGQTLDHYDTMEGGKLFWYFENNDDIQKDISDHLSGKLSLPTLNFCNSQKTLRNQIRNARQSQ